MVAPTVEQGEYVDRERKFVRFRVVEDVDPYGVCSMNGRKVNRPYGQYANGVKEKVTEELRLSLITTIKE